jgi:hypothetical protein
MGAESPRLLDNNYCSESHPAGIIIERFTAVYQSIGWEVPIRVSAGDGNDDLLVVRYLHNLSKNLRIQHPLIFDASAKTDAESGQAKGLHGCPKVGEKLYFKNRNSILKIRRK